MELTPLKYFLAVAEELHFGKAAKRLHVSQPPLSLQIRKLEGELGVKLFRRTSRVVALTAEGRFFAREARAVLERAALAEERMEHVVAGERGMLAIGFNEPALNTFLPETVLQFKKNWPEVAIQLYEIPTGGQFEALRTGTIQIGIMRPYGCALRGFGHWRILTEEYMLAVPAGHPLERLARIPLSQLSGAGLILFPARVNPALHRKILETLRNAGGEPFVRQEAESKTTMLALVGAGLGCALTPASCTANPPPNVIFRPVEPGLPDVETEAVWRPENLGVVAENFLRLLAGRIGTGRTPRTEQKHERHAEQEYKS